MKRFLLSVMVFALIISAIPAAVTALQEEEQNENYVHNETGYVDIVYNETGFVWNDKWLTENSHVYRPDLVKACAALSALVYDKSDIDHVLTCSQSDDFSYDNTGMGFELVDQGTSYGARTFQDNDHVAYRIARKTYYKDGQKFILYCIPIRGTTGAEWFSNFTNLGENANGYHEGFYLAADELMRELRGIFAEEDKTEPSQRCVLITGHSRGAAVSNIVSSWLIEEGLVSSFNLFSYNIACPNVSKHVQSYPCIFNILNKGDVVPTMPLAAWGYGRNGIDKEFKIREGSDIYSHLTQVEGSPFATATGNAGFVELMTTLLPEEKDYFKPLAQLAFYEIAAAMGGGQDLDTIDLELFRQKVKGLEIAAGAGLVADDLAQVTDYFRTAVLDIIEYHSETLGMVQDFWDAIASIGSDENPLEKLGTALRNRLERIWNKSIESLDDITGASQRVEAAKAQGEMIRDMTGAIMQLFEDTEGDLLSVANAHLQDTYYGWTCTKYFGYKGYYGDTEKSDISLYTTEEGVITAVGPCCFENCTGLTEVVLTPYLRHVGYASFSQSAISGSLDFMEGLLSVGDHAFYECSGLTAIHLPHTVKWIGYNAFKCEGVTEVTLPVEVPGKDAFTVPNTETIHYLCGSTGIMPDRRAYNGTSLPGLDVSTTLENSCIEKLTTIDFEEGIVHIGDLAYEANVHSQIVNGALTNVTLPPTLESIGSDAFGYQESLKNIVLPDSLQSLGSSCFQRCGLEEISIPEAIEEIPEYCFFYCSQLHSIELPEGLKTIATYAFSECTDLEAAHLPHTLESLGDFAFYNTASLTEVSIPVELCDSNLIFPFNSVGKIEKIHYLLGSTGIMPDKAECNGLEQSVGSTLKEVDFEEGIKRIGEYAFALMGPYGVGSGTGALEKVTLPASLKSIGRSAFHGCSAIREIALPEGLETLGEHALARTAFTKLDIPSTVTGIGAGCFEQEDHLALIRFHGDAPVFEGTDVFLYTVAELTWPQEAAGWEAAMEALNTSSLFCHSDAEPVLTVPGIRILEESALQNIGVSIIELTSGVESVGQDAFRNDNRDMLIRVPASVRQIHENAFRSQKRVFIAAPENSSAAEYVKNSQNNSLYLIIVPD